MRRSLSSRDRAASAVQTSFDGFEQVIDIEWREKYRTTLFIEFSSHVRERKDGKCRDDKHGSRMHRRARLKISWKQMPVGNSIEHHVEHNQAWRVFRDEMSRRLRDDRDAESLCLCRD